MSLQCAHPDIISDEQIAVAISHGGFGSHAGIIFRNANKETCVLHLAWHQKLKSEQFPGSQMCWVAVVPNLPKSTTKALIGNLRKIAKRNPLISYGVKVLEAFGSFSQNGDYKPVKNGNGLTCATFVTEIFRALGISILDEKTWPEGQNPAWIIEIADALQHAGADQGHVDSVRACPNARRILPAEVVAGVDRSYKDWPSKHEIISPLAPIVTNELAQLCPRH